jgi:hypothetical protein
MASTPPGMRPYSAQGIFLPIPQEMGMTELEMNDDRETEEFTDELSDEALDREGTSEMMCGIVSRAGN